MSFTPDLLRKDCKENKKNPKRKKKVLGMTAISLVIIILFPVYDCLQLKWMHIGQNHPVCLLASFCKSFNILTTCFAVYVYISRYANCVWEQDGWQKMVAYLLVCLNAFIVLLLLGWLVYDLVQLKQIRPIKFIQEITAAAETNKMCWLLRSTENWTK